MIDLSNPQVLRNHLITKMKEGKGEFYEKKVLVFKNEDGMEFIAPDEVVEHLKKLKEVEKEEAKPTKKAKE